MTTQTQMLGTPRDDLAAAQLGIEPVPERHRVLGFLDYFVLWADLGVGLLVLTRPSFRPRRPGRPPKDLARRTPGGAEVAGRRRPRRTQPQGASGSF